MDLAKHSIGIGVWYVVFPTGCMFTDHLYKPVEKYLVVIGGLKSKGNRKIIMELSLPSYRDGKQEFKYTGHSRQICSPTQSPEEGTVSSSGSFDFVAPW